MQNLQTYRICNMHFVPQKVHLRMSDKYTCKAQKNNTTTPVADPLTRRKLLGMFTATVGVSLYGNKAEAETFLQSTGARGILVEEEEKLYRLRQERESEARQQLLAFEKELEEEATKTQAGKLCATPFGVDIVGITELICLIGALVGGISARQRKNELEKLNEQLRKINVSLRQQARSGTVYAPGLSYAPPTASFSDDPAYGMVSAAATLTLPKAALSQAKTAVQEPATLTPSSSSSQAVSNSVSRTYLSMDEDDMTSDQVHCRASLREGKRLLKEKNGAAAMVRFEKALMLSKALADKVQQRRAFRGLAASARLQGQHKTAIKHLERVLEISKEMHEYTGDADAFGVIADCYTDLGEFEKAAQYYDRYIECMNNDGPV